MPASVIGSEPGPCRCSFPHSIQMAQRSASSIWFALSETCSCVIGRAFPRYSFHQSFGVGVYLTAPGVWRARPDNGHYKLSVIDSGYRTPHNLLLPFVRVCPAIFLRSFGAASSLSVVITLRQVEGSMSRLRWFAVRLCLSLCARNP
jgi:hypothetical protein